MQQLMRHRRVAMVAAALGVATLVVASPAYADPIEGHEIRQFQITPQTSPLRVNSTPITIVDPEACASGTAYVALTRPGNELTPSKWIRFSTDQHATSDSSLRNYTGASSVADTNESNAFLLEYGTSWSVVRSCWTSGSFTTPPSEGTLAPGSPVYMVTVKKLTEAEAAAHLGGTAAPAWATLVPVVGSEEAVPTAPTRVTVAPGDQSLAVSWDAVTANPAVSGYKIAVTAGGTPVAGSPFAAGAGETRAVINGLAAGTQYTVTVTATNSLGDGPASASVTGIPNFSSGRVAVKVDVPVSGYGSLSLRVPTSGVADLGNAVEQGDGTFRASGRLGEITVTDRRVPIDRTPWSLQATVSDFVSTADATKKFSSAQLGSAPTVTGAGLTAGPAQAAGSGQETRLLANAVAGSSGGTATATVNADLSLVVPRGITKGTYRSTMTVDLIKS
ncbi:hypothetical protein Pth03_53450 [Planotetraspora thailandica]|uniref:Fibronectin type-III domain-containing protein n=1 Tax=Planotetraspora thailandica TaxID=487172 RepID=A0A8J3V8Q9_9ACTN|nr:fibronectin type III domain-containing protein [Planotetraspora thailandica]GII56956.1 hypothetical protein Pth03_53450 [Planotetraspora thailandica]